MNTIKRRIGETICIGNDVRVTLLGARNGQASICVQAPAGVQVVREEGYQPPRETGLSPTVVVTGCDQDARHEHG